MAFSMRLVSTSLIFSGSPMTGGKSPGKLTTSSCVSSSSARRFATRCDSFTRSMSIGLSETALASSRVVYSRRLTRRESLSLSSSIAPSFSRTTSSLQFASERANVLAYALMIEMGVCNSCETSASRTERM